MPSPVAYLDISPLRETHWTGISNVVAGLTKRALADDSINWRFIDDSFEIPRALVQRMIFERSGAAVRLIILGSVWSQKLFDSRAAANCKCLFTHIKTIRGYFAQEAMIVHDLSPLLTPQFHKEETINHFSYRFRGDVETSSHFFPVSAATRDDLEWYFGVPRSASTVISLGTDIDLADLSLAQDIARFHQVEPYVLVLGTLEPRKNGGLVLDYIARNPGFAHRYRIIFVGRDGWLNQRERLVAKAEAAGVPRDRIVFSGFVSDREKVGLIYNAAFCIYPSFFEGFGLPILEAHVLGKLVVCSKTSSMPEVAPSGSLFFDPTSTIDFARALAIAERRAPQLRPSLSLTEVEDRLHQHGWASCYAAIQSWVRS